MLLANFKTVFLREGSGRVWTRMFRIFFFVALFGILCFFIWMWYVVVYHPKDRVEEMKQKLLEQVGEKQFDEKQFQRVLKDLEEENLLPESGGQGRDIFYSE